MNTLYLHWKRLIAWASKRRFELGILVGGLLLMNSIFLAEAFRGTNAVSPAGAGQLGDFVGGYVGTFFAIVSVVLLTSTLRSQRKSADLLSFEAKYFELLRLHRENVAELEIGDASGRRFLIALLREFRSAHLEARAVAQRRAQAFTQQQLVHIAYYSVFYGASPNFDRMLSDSLREYDPAFVSELVTKLGKAETKDHWRSEGNLPYTPFEGHQSRLGHYFRHLYQAIKYVDERPIDIDKYEYVKTIRAQLSNHEQAILLLNSLTPVGRNWWKYDFILKYRLVQNLPRNFFHPDHELSTDLLPFPKDYFEWEEVESAT